VTDIDVHSVSASNDRITRATLVSLGPSAFAGSVLRPEAGDRAVEAFLGQLRDFLRHRNLDESVLVKITYETSTR